MSQRIRRDELVAHLHRHFEGQSFVLAAWLGGSEASGRTDEFSDVDLQLIVEDEAVERSFRSLREALAELGPVELSYRLPEPTWHGFSQEFLRLSNCDPHHFLDFVVIPGSTPPEGRLLEQERHGTPRVLFDRGSWLTPTSLDRSSHGQRLRARFEVLCTTFELFGPMLTRSVARGLPVEAAGFYARFVLQPLVELLRMRHAPDRFDFGLRYLDRDLPTEDHEFVQGLAFPRDARDCDRLQGIATERFRRELAELEAGEWSLPPDS